MFDLKSQVLNGPIPGESLTGTPGNKPYEQPPQHTTVDDAMNDILSSLQNKNNVYHFLALLEAGVPMNVIVGTMLQSGFAEGKWQPNLSFMLMAPLSALLIRIAKEAGIKYTPSYSTKRDSSLDTLYAMIEKKKAKQVPQAEVDKFNEELKEQLDENKSNPPSTSAGPPMGGLMSPTKTMRQ